MKKHQLSIAVVIPVFNEAKRIGAVLSDLKGQKMSVYVVDDGSADTSSAIAKRYGAKVVRLDHNQGKGEAMRVGAEEAFARGADAVVFVDGDGQHKASDLHFFVDALQVGGFDVVFGSRNLSMGVPLVRYMGNKFASVLINLLFGIYISDLICGYRAMTKRAFESMKWESKRYGVETEMVILTGLKKLSYCEVPVEVIYYDTFKGVTLLDAAKIFGDVLKWKFFSKIS